jgi:hypothetical protein
MKKGTLSVPKREPPAESQKQELVMIPAVLVAAKDSPPSPQLLHGTAVVVTRFSIFYVF